MKVCHDINQQACQRMFAKRSDMCDDPCIANICKDTCRYCRKLCFNVVFSVVVVALLDVIVYLKEMFHFFKLLIVAWRVVITKTCRSLYFYI